MKKHNSNTLLISFAVLFLFTFFISSSCRRNKKCTLIINVQNVNTNGPVVGASVHVYPNRTNSTGNLKTQDVTASTNASGVARFTFKLPAILQADVTPPAPLNPVTKLVTLEEGKTVNVTIKVQ